MKTNLTVTEKRYLKPFSKKHILLPTKFKKPLVKGWNKFYAEKRSIEQLLILNNEYSLRTGTRIGNYYFIALDLDDLWAKERIKVSRYVETNQGLHRYLWIKELPKSCWLVNQNGDPIGQLHSKGRFVVGIGSIHESGIKYSLKGKVNEKWSLEFETLKELQKFLRERDIFTTPWGKTGLENIRDLEFYQSKPVRSVKSLDFPKSQKLSETQKYYQQKKKLEVKVNQRSAKVSLNICYICLVSFAKTPELIKAHLLGKRHQKKRKVYQTRKKVYSSPNRQLGQK